VASERIQRIENKETTKTLSPPRHYVMLLGAFENFPLNLRQINIYIIIITVVAIYIAFTEKRMFQDVLVKEGQICDGAVFLFSVFLKILFKSLARKGLC
jgi:hypothetical protein